MAPLKVEYAKSGRSRCCLKECSKFIEKGEVRVGTAIMMPGMDTPSYKWRHVCCFTARQVKNAGGSVDNVEGFEDLSDADQKVIARMMKGELVGDHSIIGKKTDPSALLDVAKPKATKAKAATDKKGGTAAKRPRDEDAESDATDEYEVVEAGVKECAVKKPECPYGAACFRKNPAHFVEYSHGGADEKEPGVTASRVVITAAKKDSAATTPKAKEPYHHLTPQPAPSSGDVVKKKCPHGALCFRTDAKHFAEVEH